AAPRLRLREQGKVEKPGQPMLHCEPNGESTWVSSYRSIGRVLAGQLVRSMPRSCKSFVSWRAYPGRFANCPKPRLSSFLSQGLWESSVFRSLVECSPFAVTNLKRVILHFRIVPGEQRDGIQNTGPDQHQRKRHWSWHYDIW